MFTRIARRYDLANRWMTWGQDLRWRRAVLNHATLPMGGKLLDVGTGTGELVLEAWQQDKSLLAVGADFTPAMLHQGRMRAGGDSIQWVCSDALDLPFMEGTFDAVVSAYLLRNVVDVERSLTEQYRVLKHGCHGVCLDTTPLPGDFWHFPARLYLRHVVPIIGKLIAGDIQAYEYLPQSTERFMRVEALASCMLKVGFRDVQFRRFMAGAMAIHWGVK